jgi:hypothetical protein
MTDPTEPDQIRPPEISDKQSIAIDALIGGATHREAAEKASVQRSTVTAWCNYNTPFKARLNARRQQRLQMVGEQLQEALGAAIGVLAARISEGDVDSSLALIRVVGVGHLLEAAKPGPSTSLGVQSGLASDLRAEVMMDLLGSPEFNEEVERRSEQSARLESG